MTEEQFAAHTRDLLSWALVNHDIPRRIARGSPMALNWTGYEELTATSEDDDGVTTLRFETRFSSGRITAKLRAFFTGGSITWECEIPATVVEASKARVMG